MIQPSAFLNCRLRDCRAIVRISFAIACLSSSAVVSSVAQVGPGPLAEKWRPQDGTYASPNQEFESQCGEFGDIVIALSEKVVSGREWSCKINRLSDTAPGAIRLDMTCDDFNLAERLKAPEDKQFREVMLLKRINAESMLVRKTLNGKFRGPAWQAQYCSSEAQRMFEEAQAENRARTEYRIPEQLSNPAQWRPRDGIYASPGSDFGDRCAKSGDVVIGLTGGSIAHSGAECKVVAMMSTAATAVSLTCHSTPAEQAPAPAKTADGAHENAGRERLTADVIRISRIDDNTFHMQKSVDRQFKDAGGPLAYCPEEAQRAYRARKAK
jgi:hypothetical protein